MLQAKQARAASPSQSPARRRGEGSNALQAFARDKDSLAAFRFPENDLEVEATARARSIGVPQLTENSSTPQLVSALDEYTRDFRSVVVGRLASPKVPCVVRKPIAPPRYPCDPQQSSAASAANQQLNLLNLAEQEAEETLAANAPEARLLQQYCPSYEGIYNSYRRLPHEGLKALLGDRPSHFRWLQIDCDRLAFSVGEPEPLFCSLALYRVEGKSTKKGFELDRRRSGRVSETFRFDLTSEQQRRTFALMYHGGTSGEGAAPETAVSCAHRAMFAIDPAHPEDRLYLILQVTKVLQGDPDGVLLPYAKGKGKKAEADALDAAQRLWRYRQPLAFASAAVCPSPGGASGPLISGERNMILFKQSEGLSEEGLMAAIMDASPAEGRIKSLSPLDGRFYFSATPLGDTPSNPLLAAGARPTAGEPPPGWLDPACTEPVLVDAGMADVEALPESVPAQRIAREVQYLPLLGAGGRSGAAAGSAVAGGLGHPHTSYRNFLYVYLEGLDRMRHRNLAITVELREEDGSGDAPLPAVYAQQRGSTFAGEYVACVTHHSFTPAGTDEVKVRLPDALQERHRLVFTVHHVHCKRKTSRFGKAQAEDSVEELLGVASLPLLR
jgi:C2 domain in Dock180 and Zizimin proteins